MNIDVFSIAREKLRTLDSPQKQERSMIGAELLASTIGPPVPPAAGESLAIALVKPMTAALAFDRIWGLDVNLPQSIRFGGLVYGEYDIVISAIANCWDRIARRCEQGLPWDESMDDHLQLAEGLLHDHALSCPCELFGTVEQNPGNREPNRSGSSTVNRVDGFTRELQDRWVLDLQNVITTSVGVTLSQLIGEDVVTVYDSANARETGRTTGVDEALLGILDGLKIADEKRMTWEMVEDFRADTEARQKYRRLIHWLRTSMKGKSQQEIEGEVGNRLAEYEWALKKHGIETMLGHLESILDPRLLAPTAGLAGIISLFGEPLWGALSAGGVLLGRVSLKVASYLLKREDIARIVNPEISYVYEVRKAFGNTR